MTEPKPDPIITWMLVYKGKIAWTIGCFANFDAAAAMLENAPQGMMSVVKVSIDPIEERLLSRTAVTVSPEQK